MRIVAMFSPFRNPSLELNSRTETRTAESQTPKRRSDSIAASRRATTSSRHYDLTDLAVRLQGSVIFASGNVLATIGVPLVGAIAAAHNADGLGDERLVVGIEGRAGLEQIHGRLTNLESLCSTGPAVVAGDRGSRRPAWRIDRHHGDPSIDR